MKIAYLIRDSVLVPSYQRHPRKSSGLCRIKKLGTKKTVSPRYGNIKKATNPRHKAPGIIKYSRGARRALNPPAILKTNKPNPASCFSYSYTGKVSKLAGWAY